MPKCHPLGEEPHWEAGLIVARMDKAISSDLPRKNLIAPFLVKFGEFTFFMVFEP